MRHHLDVELLANLLRNKRSGRGLRGIAREIGNVSPSTLSRVENGKMPDMETFLSLCDWLEVPPETLIRDGASQEVAPDVVPPETLAIQLRADKDLDPATANALAALVQAAYHELSQREMTLKQDTDMGLIDKLPAKFRRRCEAISTEQRSLLNLRAFERLPAYKLATQLGAKVLTPEQFSSLETKHLDALLANDSWSAAVLCPEPLLIVHNPGHALTRRESNLMHELGHVLLKHAMVEFESKTGLPVRHQKDEDEATYLGGCLQIPQRGLFWAVQQGMSLSQIAEHFGASKDMVKFRSNAVGLRQFIR